MKRQANDISVNHANGDCVSGYEGVVLGILDGKPFDTLRVDAPKAEKIAWARAHAQLNQRIANDLTKYADAMERER